MNPERWDLLWRTKVRPWFWLAVPLVCGLLFLFRILPLWQEGRQWKNKTRLLQNRQQQLRLFAMRYDAQAAGKRQLAWEKLCRQLPEEISVGSWLKKIDVLADRAGVRITQLNPMPQVQGKGCRFLPFALHLEGEYTCLLLFFQLLEQEEQLWHLEETTLTARGLQSHLQLQTRLFLACKGKIQYE